MAEMSGYNVEEGMTSMQYVVHKEGEIGTLKERSMEQDISFFKVGLCFSISDTCNKI